MSHDTHQEHSKENKTIISFKSSFWLVVIIVGLFVAALNFIKAESGGEGEEKKEGKVEMTTTNPPSAEGESKQVQTTPPVKPVVDSVNTMK